MSFCFFFDLIHKFSKSNIVRTIRELGQLGYFDAQQISPDLKNVNPTDGTLDVNYTVVEKGASQIDMGQIDTDIMFDKVMQWDWGNSESLSIYHDPETRRNSITYRMNLSRLMSKLIAEGKMDKAKKVIDLAKRIEEGVI